LWDILAGDGPKEAVSDVKITQEKAPAQARPRASRLEQSKAAVLNALTSKSGERSYDPLTALRHE
jgi:hypothetical protein